MSQKYNNFPLYFPGCLYRTFEGYSKTCKDLDEVLAEINFDLKIFNEINGRILHQINKTKELYFREFRDKKSLTAEEKEEMERLFAENNKDIQLFDELLEPAYTAMRNRGYSHEDLWR